MKCFGHIFHQLMKHTKSHSDPYQFAYKHKYRRRNTHSFAMHIYTHLQKKGLFVQILFIDFCSAFKVQYHTSKLLKFNVNRRLILWIVDFLVNCSQTVRHQAALLSSCTVSTSTSQGAVLSPILFTLYINDCTGTETTPIIKYSDCLFC